MRVEYFMLHLRQAVTRVMQLWQNLQTEDSYAGTFTAAFFGFPSFLCKRTAQPNQRNEENCVKKIFLLSSANDPIILSYFVPGANTKPLGARALNLNRKKINFSTRQTFLLLSYACSYFLFSNFAVRNFILFTLDFIRNRKCGINWKLKFVLMRSAFYCGVA